MRVLQICPIWYPIHTDAPGGIETLLPNLIAGLSALGCKLTSLATADSKVEGELVSAVPSGLVEKMSAGEASEYVYYEQHLVQLAMRSASQFDIIHSHIGPPAYSLSGLRVPVVHTQHTPITDDLIWFVNQHPNMQIATVSEFQARKLRAAGALRVDVIANGIATSKFAFSDSHGESLLFIGRIEPVKGVDAAIHVSRTLNRPLKIAGPIVNREYFREQIEPCLNEQIQYIGVLDHRQKVAAFGSSACTVLPFRGEEPFGLVTIESMACGTPVVSLPNGALPEIIEESHTGFLGQTEAHLSDAVERAIRLNRAHVRARAVRRFDIEVVAAQYHRLFEKLLSERGA